MRIPYGYLRNDTGQICVDVEKAKTVRFIYNLYLQGKSLGGIANALKKQNVLSSTGNSLWSRAAIDKILNNERYVPSIISEERFWKVQIERENRTNKDDNGRKATRYNSQNVLSGLLVCGECECNYRRITRPSGEVVWRCAEKVENGKRSKCTNKTTVSEEQIKRIICEKLNLDLFNNNVIKDKIQKISIEKHKTITTLKTSQLLKQ